MKYWVPPTFLFLAVAVRGADATHDVRFEPMFIETVTIQPYRQRVDTRVDLALDNFKTHEGTQTVKGLFTRCRPSLEYRYAPAPNTEILFRGIYTAQSVEYTSSDGRRVDGRYSAGFSDPTIGFKLVLFPWAAVAFHTEPPTAATRNPPLGDGAHFGGDLLFKAGPCHFSIGHTARPAYTVHTSSETFRREAGDVTDFAFALTKKDLPSYRKNDYVGPLAELHGIYTDRSRLDGQDVKDSAGFSGLAVFGFVLGKIDPQTVQRTRVAISVGFGDRLHKTQDPLFGVGELQLTVGYGLLWGPQL